MYYQKKVLCNQYFYLPSTTDFYQVTFVYNKVPKYTKITIYFINPLLYVQCLPI